MPQTTEHQPGREQQGMTRDFHCFHTGSSEYINHQWLFEGNSLTLYQQLAHAVITL